MALIERLTGLITACAVFSLVWQNSHSAALVPLAFAILAFGRTKDL